MATLSDPIKLFIVQSLACYETPERVASAVREQFGVVVSRQQCQAYDPGTRQGQALSRKWRELFAEARAKFKAAAVDVPIAHRAYRLKVLQRLVVKADQQGNSMLVLSLLEQAAKEVGGIFVNRSRGAGDDEVPAPAKVARV